MPRAKHWIALCGLAFAATVLCAQDGPQKATIKKIDAEKNTVTLTVGGQDRTYQVSPETMLKGADRRDLARRLQSPTLKPGAAVMFMARDADGKQMLVGMMLQGTSGDIQRARIKTLNLDKMTITLVHNGKECALRLTDATQVLDAQGDTLMERLRAFKEGTEVQFKAGERDGTPILVGIRLADAPGKAPPPVKFDSSGLKPLTELTGAEKYKGYAGGLYGNGNNDRPAAHEAAGMALAQQVRPLDGDGKPAPDGTIVLLSVGMSNTAQASAGFQQVIRVYPDINPHVHFVNGAVGGMTARAIQNPDDNASGSKYWKTVGQRLAQAKVTPAQVQAIWIKEADAGPTQGFPKYAQTLEEELERIVQLLPGRFPNLKLVYLSSRTYGGYAMTRLNPEPYAYESAFSVQWLIEKQLRGDPALNDDAKKGPVRAPWLSWGPYLWANGSKKRAGDGFAYAREDFSPKDGTHLTSSGERKVGQLMLDFFKNDTTTRPWFTKAGQRP